MSRPGGFRRGGFRPSGFRRGGFEEFGRPLRVEGGLKARSERGDIGESWWSKRFLAVLESFALGSRLTRGRNYARKGQVLSLDVEPGVVVASVQGSRPTPYRVKIGLTEFDDKTWRQVEAALAGQAIFSARLLAGEMPAEIEEVFAAAGHPLFPTRVAQLAMSCSCPDPAVPCKHIAATFYLLAEAFDDDPFQILHWRGRDRSSCWPGCANFARAGTVSRLDRRATPRRKRPAKAAAVPTAAVGAAGALSGLKSPDLAEVVDRFWVVPVPLPRQPSTLDIGSDLLLRQLPTPGSRPRRRRVGGAPAPDVRAVRNGPARHRRCGLNTDVGRCNTRSTHSHAVSADGDQASRRPQARACATIPVETPPPIGRSSRCAPRAGAHRVTARDRPPGRTSSHKRPDRVRQSRSPSFDVDTQKGSGSAVPQQAVPSVPVQAAV